MKFVFAIHGWYLGGFATFCRNLASGLHQRGHQVALLVLPDARREFPLRPGVFQQCVVIPRGLGRLGPHIARVVRAIDRLEPDVLVLNDSPYAMAALPFIQRARLRLPVVHSIAPDEVKLGLSHEAWWDRLVTVSDSVGQAIKARGMGSRASVCPLGVPLPPARPRREPGAAGPLEIISVSRVVVHQKRIDRLPAIARVLAQQGVGFHWTVLGDGEALPRLRQELRRSGLGEHFSFKGAVAASAVAQALTEANVFVLTSDCEGMPQALLEAMAYGLVPVVSRIAGSTTSLVQDGRSGFLCEPSAAAEFATAISTLAHDPARRCEMADSASRLVAERFSLESFSSRFLEIVAATQAQVQRRPVPLPTSALLGARPAFRCLGFWRSCRHQSLGRLKRWVVSHTNTCLAPRCALERWPV